MAKIEVKAFWADPEKFTAQLVECCGKVEYKTKAGKIVNPFLFACAEGEFYCFQERIANLRELVKAGLDDDLKFQGKRFFMSPLKDTLKFNLRFEPNL